MSGKTRALQPGDANTIRRNYLYDEVADRLRALIQAGEMKPRQRLNENELAQRFGISRTPLREAIKLLAHEGLLDILPNRGAQVASISLVEIEEVLEVIAGLEAIAGELACKNATDTEVEAIAAMTASMADAHRKNDAPAYFELNQKIHEAIVDGSGNATLKALYQSLSTRIQRARFTAHKTTQQWAAAMQDHETIVDVLRRRDGERLSNVLRAHIRSKKTVIAGTFTDD